MIDLSHTEIALLSVLHPKEELAGREVASAFAEKYMRSLSLGTLYTTLRRLKEQGLVETRDDEDEDGRVRFFTISADGLRAYRTAGSHYASVFEPLWQPKMA